MNKTQLVWKNELAFAVKQDGHEFYLDGDKDFGGQDMGPKPKGLLLSALAGCSGMDAVSILKKMRIPEYRLTIDVEGDLADEQPAVFKHINLIFRFEGEELPVDKLKRAVELSTAKYCPVYAMLAKAVPIDTKIFLNEKEV